MKYLKSDIWLVDFDPSSGHEFQKVRPAVIIESNEQLRTNNLATIMPLTSNLEKQRTEDILVNKSSKNRLFANSLIKVHHITSFDRNKRFIKKIGNLEDRYVRQIEEYLKLHFGLD
ncbi:MAG: type II toxin-antitoxin system PemK/MazF family toxin [Pseudomonadota bacterium]